MAFNLQRLFEVCRNVENAVEFCVFHKILPSKNAKNCVDCGAEEKVMWQKRSRNKNLPYCLKCSNCHKETNLALNTWFQNSKLTILQSLSLVYFWLLGLKTEAAALECGVNLTTVIYYYRFCREVCYVVITNMDKKIGGLGHIVDVNETRLFARKYQSGQFSRDEKEDIWIFGGVDRDTKECFAVKVDNRNPVALLPFIKNFILPGTKICTDGWRTYQDLQREGFSPGDEGLEFINSENASATQRMWGAMKSEVKQKGRSSDHDELYMFEFLYRQLHRKNGRSDAATMFLNFLHDIGNVFPGYGKEMLGPKSCSVN